MPRAREALEQCEEYFRPFDLSRAYTGNQAEAQSKSRPRANEASRSSFVERISDGGYRYQWESNDSCQDCQGRDDFRNRGYQDLLEQ